MQAPTDVEMAEKLGRLMADFVWNSRGTVSDFGTRIDISNRLMDNNMILEIKEAYTNGYCNRMDEMDFR